MLINLTGRNDWSGYEVSGKKLFDSMRANLTFLDLMVSLELCYFLKRSLKVIVYSRQWYEVIWSGNFGGFSSSNGVGNMVCIHDIMHKEEYLKILQDNLNHSSVMQNIEQNNDPNHAVKIVSKWLTENNNSTFWQ